MHDCVEKVIRVGYVVTMVSTIENLDVPYHVGHETLHLSCYGKTIAPHRVHLTMGSTIAVT